jgi:adhesin transport system membrane fusion protein
MRKVETTHNYRNTAEKEMSVVFADQQTLISELVSLKEKAERTVIISPVQGYVNRILVKTAGAILSNGANIFEIVPSDNNLIAELKVKPSDIAGLHEGQVVMLKFDAYDYAIFGGIEAKITRISADTIQDEKGKYHYAIKAVADRNYILRDGKKYRIKPGMNVNANIIKGKRRIIDYILKPITKTLQSPVAG